MSLIALAIFAGVMQAQSSSPGFRPLALTSDTTPRANAPSLDSLIAQAVRRSPALHAATSRVAASRARVRPAAALPDPMLMLGIINQPLGRMPAAATGNAMSSVDGPDAMTMRMVGVSQTIPFPGKRALQRQSAEHDVEATEALLDATRRQVIRDTKAAFYEIAFIDQALDIIARTRDVLAGLITLTESRYTVGSASQQDVLKTRVEAARLARTASELVEERHAAVATLNGILDQPSERAVPRVVMPEAMVHAAVAPTSQDVRFSSTALGARAADSPLRPLAVLQDEAVQQSPEIRAHLALLAAQTSRAELSRMAVRPDVDVSLQYGQRGGGLPDMLSATVAIPLPVFRRDKQDQQVVEATAQLAVLEGEHHLMVNTIRADVTRLVSEIERERTALALAARAILPQSRAALMSATASYQVGKVEFLTVLENQSAVFGAETEYVRALSDFATRVAELERIVGQEVLK